MGQALTNVEVKLSDLKSDIDVLVVFGSGEIDRNLSLWLKKSESRYIVFVEEDEQLFFKAKESIKDSKTRLYYWQQANEEIFQVIAWEFVFLKFGYVTRDPQQTPRAQMFFSALEQYHRGVDLLASDCQDMGVRVLSNALNNLQFLPRALLGQELEGQCAGMPAIICGAGPSLARALPLLTQLRDRAILIAGGSAVQALNTHGIQPHFSAHLDPEPPRRRFLAQDTFETPVFYQGRVSHDLLSRVHGPLLWMADGGNYPLEAWLAAECGIFSERFDSGWTVANFCAAIAAHLGCSRVILIGVDFSCGPNAEPPDALIELEKDKLYSQKDWLMSADWMGAFANKHPQIQWINASEGIDMPGIARRDLAEIVLPEQYDITGMIQSLIMQAPPTNIPSEKIGAVRKHLAQSFMKSVELCNSLLKVWEKYYPHSPLEKGDYALLENELEQEVCFSQFLLPLWTVWKRPILRKDFHPLGQHIHRLLFFKKAIEFHLPQLRSYL